MDEEVTVVEHRTRTAMASRNEAAGALDYFPTPPWATRALMEHVIPGEGRTCWDPACGGGHMSEVLEEYFERVRSTDIADYGYGLAGVDFLEEPYNEHEDWIITNPPFNLAEQFAARRHGCNMALLVRTAWLEGAGRWSRLFSVDPPTTVAQFTERVTMVKGGLAPKGVSSATAYCWVVWYADAVSSGTRLIWIPPCKKELGG